MPQSKTYGINFPFQDSPEGKYLKLSTSKDDEVKNSLLHLLLTRKGTRYYLPNFGTRLYEYIFEQMDGTTFSQLESEIRDSIAEFIPNIVINSIEIKSAADEDEGKGTYINSEDQKTYVVPNIATKEHTAKIKIDYTITDSSFNASDFIIINV